LFFATLDRSALPGSGLIIIGTHRRENTNLDVIRQPVSLLYGCGFVEFPVDARIVIAPGSFERRPSSPG
jgi:hypothetical protein